jgi:arabinan endo-1,5-alpha-L-arabinosidase
MRSAIQFIVRDGGGWLCCVAFTAVVIFATSIQAATVAYYRFEEGTTGSPASSANGAILDSSGNGINGTAFNGPVYSANVPVNPVPAVGLPNAHALSFNGTNQRVFVPNVPALSLTHSLTLEAWIDPDTIQPGNADGNIIFRGDDGGGNDPYRLTFTSDGQGNNSVFFEVEASGVDTATVSAPVPLHQWSHVAGTLDDATGAMKIYVNGQLKQSITTTLRPFEILFGSNPGIGIGALQSSSQFVGPEYFHGLLDEVRISDAALPPSQLLAPEPSALAFSLIAIPLLLGRRR